VLVWAEEEDLLLANDAALAVLQSDDEGVCGEGAGLESALRRRVGRDRRFRTARASVRGEVGGVAAIAGDGGAGSLRLLASLVRRIGRLARRG
jgi:hypothetical protein